MPGKRACAVTASSGRVRSNEQSEHAAQPRCQNKFIGRAGDGVHTQLVVLAVRSPDESTSEMHLVVVHAMKTEGPDWRTETRSAPVNG